MNTKKAFTLVELLAVIAILGVLSCLLLPVLARTRGKSTAAGCLSNLRQLMGGWSMYKEENNDFLMPNSPLATPASRGWIDSTSGSEGWGPLPGNTNATTLQSGLMSPYVQNDVHVFKCPADVVPSLNGQRLRSYSMNGQTGAAYYFSNTNSGPGSYDAPALLYVKGSDFTCPTPGNAFIFCEEHPGSINDGFFQVQSNSPIFPDVPATYMGGSSGLSFADGHSEIHAWQTSTLLVPVVSGQSVLNLIPAGGTGNADWRWFSQRSACTHR